MTEPQRTEGGAEAGRMPEARLFIPPAPCGPILVLGVCFCSFTTELAVRRARQRTWDGLGSEMTRAGWFDA
jgi:hypothetical protein